MRATVIGLERFCALMWKGIQCDGCGQAMKAVTLFACLMFRDIPHQFVPTA